jgi:hypothetical protein
LKFGIRLCTFEISSDRKSSIPPLITSPNQTMGLIFPC